MQSAGRVVWMNARTVVLVDALNEKVVAQQPIEGHVVRVPELRSLLGE